MSQPTSKELSSRLWAARRDPSLRTYELMQEAGDWVSLREHEIERLRLQVYALTNANKSLADAADGQPPNRHTHEPGSDGPGEEDGPWAEGWAQRSQQHDPAMCDANERLATIMVGAAGQHAERVVELEAEVSTLRESLAEVNRLLSLNVAEVERLRSTQPPLSEHPVPKVDWQIATDALREIAGYVGPDEAFDFTARQMRATAKDALSVIESNERLRAAATKPAESVVEVCPGCGYLHGGHKGGCPTLGEAHE